MMNRAKLPQTKAQMNAKEKLIHLLVISLKLQLIARI